MRNHFRRRRGIRFSSTKNLSLKDECYYIYTHTHTHTHMPRFVFKRNKIKPYSYVESIYAMKKNAKQNAHGGGCNYALYMRGDFNALSQIPNSSWISIAYYTKFTHTFWLINFDHYYLDYNNNSVNIYYMYNYIVQWTFTF